MMTAARENIEREFYGDVRSRKSLVPSARHKKCGSKTSFVSLPHDNMTKGAWKKMNGETQSYNLKGPMSWDDFKSLPVDLMKEYLQFLRDEFSATGANIADVLGITYSTLNRLMNEKNIYGIFHRGAKQPKKEIERMKLFFYPEPEESNVATEPEAEIEKVELETVSPVQLSEETKAPPLFRSNMTNFTMQFDGPYDEKSIINTMRLLVGEGTNCKIQITVEKEETTDG